MRSGTIMIGNLTEDEYRREHLTRRQLIDQLALAERRLEIAEKALGKYADRKNWTCVEDRECMDLWLADDNGWEPAANALKEMSEVK